MKLMPATFQAKYPKPETFNLLWKLQRPAFVSTDGTFPQDTLDATAKLFKSSAFLKPGQKLPGTMIDNTFILDAYKTVGTKAPVVPVHLKDALGE
jgi:hypothetical protein